MSSSPVKQAYWTLAADFTELLSRPVELVLDELVPVVAPAAPIEPRKAEPKLTEEKPAFLAALDAADSAPNARTSNGALGYASTGDELLDLFNDLTPGITGSALFGHLDKAWAVDPEVTLRIIFHARSIHEGKGFKYGFLRCVAWLYEKHPRTLFANLHLIVDPTCERARSKKRDAAKAARKLADNEGVLMLDDDGNVETEKEPEYPPRPHGTFDDLNDILMLAVNGQLTTAYTEQLTGVDGALADKATATKFKQARIGGAGAQKDGAPNATIRRKAFCQQAKSVGVYGKKKAQGGKAMPKGHRGEWIGPGFSDDEAEAEDDQTMVEKETEEKVEDSFLAKLAKCGSKQMRAALIRERMDKSMEDPKLRALYVAVVDLYAGYLTADLARLDEHLKYLSLPEDQRKEQGYGAPGSSPHLFGMSYAAKWAPTPGKSADKQLHVATAIALRLFSGENLDTRTARGLFQSKVLTPLRRVLAVPETKMVKGDWSIEYAKVPARAMARYKDAFWEHDKKGFEKYLMKVAEGKSTIAGASMMPHHILSEALFGNDVGTRVADMQWASLVDSIRSSSDKELMNCIAVADVSGSMGDLYPKLEGSQKDRPPAIWPCIALTLLMTELAHPPWNGAFITFSANPQLQHLDMDLRLSERARNLNRAEWDMNTDYNEVFKHILNAAKRAQLPRDQMVKKVFVFSDMQFDESISGTYGQTEHEKVVDMFEKAGYDMPELVYWNLQAGATKPVAGDTPGTSLVSGFSGALMKYFIRSLGNEPEEDEEEVKEDEKMDDSEDEDDWEEVKNELKEIKKKEKKLKEAKTPLQHMMKIVGKKVFDGLVMVD